MAFITADFLRQRANDSVLESRANAMIMKNASAPGGKHIFLSHSHKDRETANRLKQRIARSDHVLVLATNQALASRWVPWEIGVADIGKTPAGVSILPVADSSGRFEGNEYLQLYRRVIVADNGNIAVFEPGTTQGQRIGSWLRTL